MKKDEKSEAQRGEQTSQKLARGSAGSMSLLLDAVASLWSRRWADTVLCTVESRALSDPRGLVCTFKGQGEGRDALSWAARFGSCPGGKHWLSEES